MALTLAPVPGSKALFAKNDFSKSSGGKEIERADNDETIYPVSDEGYLTVFEFLDHTEIAHISSGGLFIDFGGPGRHKYTLRKEHSGFLKDFTLNGRNYTSLRHGISSVRFDSEDEDLEAGTILIGGIGESQSSAHVYLNGTWIGKVRFGSTDLSTELIEFDPALIERQNEIQFQCGEAKPSPLDNRPCVSLDFLKIGSAILGEPKTELDGAIADLARARETRTVILPEGGSIRYNIPLPHGALLFIDDLFSLSEQESSFEVIVEIDGRNRPIIAESHFKTSAKNVSMPLGDFGGQAASVSFHATRGSVRMKNPRLMVPKLDIRATTEKTRAKNIVIILVDTLRADRLRAFNSETRVRAPIINGVAREAAIFDRASAQASWTKPSVATILTGLFPKRHNVQKHRSKLPSEVPTVSSHFQKNGFRTAAFVANGYISEEFGFSRGFEHFVNYGSQNKPNEARYVFQDAAAWIEENDKDKPFFLYVHTVDPHAPYSPPSRFRNIYDKHAGGGVVSPTRTAELLSQINSSQIDVSLRDRHRLEALYDAEISYHDSQLAVVMKALRKNRLLDNTLLVITADHGEEFFDHGKVGHSHSLFEELIHVPLIVRLPGATHKTGRHLDANVQLVDIFPTACEVLGVACPANIDGRSLLPLLKGQYWDGYPRASFADLPDQGLYSVRMGDLKAIFNRRSPRYFDLMGVGKENSDLAGTNAIKMAMLRDTLGIHLSRLENSISIGGGPTYYEEERAVIGNETMLQLRRLGYVDD